MTHMAVDNDIHLEGMCGKCKHELENKKCNSCGEHMFDESAEKNPFFDEEMFERLKGNSNKG